MFVVPASETNPDGSIILNEDDGRLVSIQLIYEAGVVPPGGIPVLWTGDFGGFFFDEPTRFDGNRPEPPQGFINIVPIENRGTEFEVAPLTIDESALSFFIFDDTIEEAPITYDLLLEALSEDVIIGNSNVVVTLQDGPNSNPGEGPIVSLSVTETELEEGDEFTVNFTVVGDIPPEGVTVYVDGDFQSLSEFNIFGDDGIDPDTDLVGLAGFPEQDQDAGGFFATITQPEASITLSVFEGDGPNEGQEAITFDLVNGELYEVPPDGDGQSVTLIIDDGGEDAEYVLESGVTSVYLDFDLLEDVAGVTLVSADSDATPEPRPASLPEFQVGFEITEETDFSFEPVGFVPVGGSIEHDGTITLAVGGTQVTVGEFSIGYDPTRESETASGFFVADTLDDDLGLGILFDLGIPETATVAGPTGEDFDLGDADLLLSPELAGA